MYWQILKLGTIIFSYLICSFKGVVIPIQVTRQNTDSLLLAVRNTYNKDAAAGIKKAGNIYVTAKNRKDALAAIKAANLIGQLYWEKRSYNTARVYIGYALENNDHLKADLQYADSWMILGLIDHSAGIYPKAIEEYDKAGKYYKLVHKASDMAKSYLNSGMCQIQLSQYDNAIKNCLQAAGVFESLKDNTNAANAYKAIGSCFLHLSDYQLAIAYNKKALAIRTKLKDTLAIAQSLNNIGNAFREAQKPDSAIVYLLHCLVLRKNEKDSSKLVLTLQNIGSSYWQKGNTAVAKLYILRSLKIAGNYAMQEELARGNLDLARIYLAEKNINKAWNAINVTETTAKALKLPDLLMDAYTTIIAVYLEQGNYKAAFAHNTLKNTLKDSIFTIAKNNNISELEVKYQTLQKEKDLAALHAQYNLQNTIVVQQQRLIISLAVAAALLFVLFGVVYNNYRLKNKANQRIQTLMRELHHRVKNNLQILSGLFTMQIEGLSDESTRNTLRENETRLASMNLVHHILYQDNDNTQIEMSDYLIKLLTHIKQSFGADSNKNVVLRTDMEIIQLDADKAVAIGLIVNELATNALKYAFDDKGGEIYLQLKRLSKSKITLQLRDNGRGIDEFNGDKAISFGLKLVNLMARQLQTMISVKTNAGTIYQMEIPI